MYVTWVAIGKKCAMLRSHKEVNSVISTEERKTYFLQVFATYPYIKQASKAANISRVTVWRWLQSDAVFKQSLMQVYEAEQQRNYVAHMQTLQAREAERQQKAQERVDALLKRRKAKEEYQQAQERALMSGVEDHEYVRTVDRLIRTCDVLLDRIKELQS